jgi:radical SAM protein (TIGR01212 family)
MPANTGVQKLNLYSQQLRFHFGTRVQKISIHLGLNCPNRDSSGEGGCSYCSPASFLPPNADHRIPPTAQLEAGIAQFRAKYPDQKYLAYIQGYTGTLAPASRLEDWYRSLLAHPGCSGLVVGTRPDCLPPAVLRLIADLRVDFPDKMIRVELGVESFDDRVLAAANRGCSARQSRLAIRSLASLGIPVDIHLILGLPGALPRENPADEINALPVSMVKFHQFQIVDGSSWARRYRLISNTSDEAWSETEPGAGKISALDRDLLHAARFSVDDYLQSLVPIIAELSPDTSIGRLAADSPRDLVHAHPSWQNTKNFRITELLRQRLASASLYQGIYYDG